MKICMYAFGVGRRDGVFVGGHVNNLLNLGRSLSNSYEVHVVTVPPLHADTPIPPVEKLDEGLYLHTVRRDAISDTVTNSGRRGWRYGVVSSISISRKIYALDREHDFDILHGHSGFSPVGLTGEAAKVLRRTPTLHTLYCPVDSDYMSRLTARASLGIVDTVIPISENVDESLEEIVRPSRRKTIPPLIDYSRYSPPDDLTQSSNEVFYLGNFSREKGVDILLEAFSEVVDEVPEAKLHLAFDMPLDEYHSNDLEVKDKIRNLGLQENVIPEGLVEDLPSLLRKMDVCVVPFRNTQGPADYPLSMLEAMSCGVVPVATPVGGIPEILQHNQNGILCPADDVNNMSRSIVRLLRDNDLRSRLGAEAVETVSDLNYEILDKYREMYEEF